MDGGKNVRPGHRELRQPYSSAQAIGLAIRPLRRFVDFSSIIERAAARRAGRQQPHARGGCGGGDSGFSSVRTAAGTRHWRPELRSN